MRWKVGREYATRGGRRVRVLAVDAPTRIVPEWVDTDERLPYPILSMDLVNGDLHSHTWEGRIFSKLESGYDLIIPTRKVEGWTLYVEGDNALHKLLPTREDAERYWMTAYGPKVFVFVSFQIEED